MRSPFNAKIYKTGINWCVDVPLRITKSMKPEKGYIFIKGKINNYGFTKSLVPVKNKPYRLFVNAAMMKGGDTALGKTASFIIAQVKKEKPVNYHMPVLLRQALKENKLNKAFAALSASRKKDILKYLSFITQKETIMKNVNKLISQLKSHKKDRTNPLELTLSVRRLIIFQINNFHNFTI